MNKFAQNLINKQEHVYNIWSGQELFISVWAIVVLPNTMLWHPKCHNKGQPKSRLVIEPIALTLGISSHWLTGMIKKCLWRGRLISCAAIFKMQPTDRGMCCSFNKEKAEEMFTEGRYQEHLMKMIAQDATQAMGGSGMPEWWDSSFYYLIQLLTCLTSWNHRFDSAPEAGESRGLDLVLDAHTDLITASSVTKPFQVITIQFKQHS